MAGRKGKIFIGDVPTRAKLAPMLEELQKCEVKTSYFMNRVAKPNKPIGYINDETKAGSKPEKYRVTINLKQQDHEFRAWLGQESMKDKEVAAKKERKVRVMEATWLDF